MDEFTKRKQISERGIDNEQFYQDIKSSILDSDQSIVVTIKDGVSSLELTGGDLLPLVGALENAKFLLAFESIQWEE